MMGGLHVEKALLKVIGDFLEGSGWTSVMTSAGVTTEGRAESLQKGTQTSRSQWAQLMFAMDHYHYARWLTLHVTDLQELPNDSVDIHRAFVKGNFVTQKSSHKFSALAHDEIHEQQNAIVKGNGRVIGITENEAALRRWMVAGSELAGIVSEFEDQFQRQKQTDVRYHEQLPSVQKSFASDLNNAISSFENWGIRSQKTVMTCMCLTPRSSCLMKG
ncbi:hypothetical protein HOLleu_04633 [Holothuria leucospilota]|uniref:Uncharacterized protein n=1 Tax=Holothuria leucospilota TaxID=206669 RepID=A0A9Q1CTJ3_HOLLE|nr:hypothetical protein HOLleu_04633 [Holothuria leucospilota]